MKITIRNASKHDIQSIVTLNEEMKKARKVLFSKLTRIFHEKLPKQSKKKPQFKVGKNEVLLLAEVSGGAVGLVWGQVKKSKGRVLDKMGNIEELIVLSAFRRQGVAKKLLNGVIAEFKKRGCDHIVLSTHWENIPARSLYTSLGMYETGVEFWKKI